MARASELPDSDSEGLTRSWRALVKLCARALGRSESNLGKAYTSDVSISRQLAALGTLLAALPSITSFTEILESCEHV
jgi:hypothetical protein